MFSTQGLNILLNIFFGPVANAAKGIAIQVQEAIRLFFLNFQLAVNPQITKSYAAGDIIYMHKLIFTSSRISFYILLLLALPVIFETEYILQLWLKIVPDHTVILTQLSVVLCAFWAFENPLNTGNFATGEIKTLLLTTGIVECIALPLAWIWLKAGGQPATVVLSRIIVFVVTFIIRLFIVRRQLRFSMCSYIKQCLLPVFEVSIICIAVVWSFCFFMREPSLLRLICLVLLSITIVGTTVWLLGITKDERQLAKQFLNKRIKRNEK